MRRNAFVDHLRVVLTALVIFHHTSIVYGGSGGWYWREQPNASNTLLLMFNAVNQSFFMGFFFLLAGYYTPASFERKGAWRFLADRFLRLGLPLLVYFFVLSPMTIALARFASGEPFWSGWWLMIRVREFEPGPLWFAEALLIFALGYAAWRAWRPREMPPLENVPGFLTLLIAALLIGGVSFLVRLGVPVGRNVAWLQLGYFPPYVLLFAVGCLAARSQLLERVTFADARPWAIVSIVMLFALPVFMTVLSGKGSFEGGWSLSALVYALWDPLIAWGIMLTLLWSFRTWWPNETPFTAALGRSAYGAYIVHPPVLVGLSVLAHGWSVPPLLKFALIGFGACAVSFAIARGMLFAPGVRRIV